MLAAVATLGRGGLGRAARWFAARCGPQSTSPLASPNWLQIGHWLSLECRSDGGRPNEGAGGGGCRKLRRSPCSTCSSPPAPAPASRAIWGPAIERHASSFAPKARGRPQSGPHWARIRRGPREARVPWTEERTTRGGPRTYLIGGAGRQLSGPAHTPTARRPPAALGGPPAGCSLGPPTGRPTSQLSTFEAPRRRRQRRQEGGGARMQREQFFLSLRRRPAVARRCPSDDDQQAAK